VRPYLRDPEAGWFIGVTLFSIFMVAMYIWKDGVYAEFETALRHAAFNVVSIATTTGYASVDYALWPIFAPLWMLFLSSFATSAGSTGGGIKMMRALLLYKQVFRELLRAMHPNAVYNVRIGGQVAPQAILFAVLASFAFMYMVSIVSMTLVLAFTGSRHHLGVHRCRCQHQQYRAGTWGGRPVDDLRSARRFPDLGVHICHAAWVVSKSSRCSSC
jgi:trk system potassium uptake protein TrkH